MPNDELRVGGYSVGGRDLMDPELTGSNVRDRETGRFNDKAPVSKIADAIRTGSSAATGAGSTGAQVSSKAASIMMQNMQPILKQLQELSDSNPEFGEELKKLIDLFKDSHKYNAKEFSEKSIEIYKQIERIKQSAGNDEQAQELASQVTAGLADEVKSEERFGGIKGKTRELFNVDKGVGLGEQVKQAFSLERMFGVGSKESQAKAEVEREKQQQAIGLASGEEGLGFFGGAASDTGGKKEASGGGTVVGKKEASAGKGKSLFSGIDKETQAEKQTEVLQDMLKVLEDIRDGKSGDSEDSGPGLFDAMLSKFGFGKNKGGAPGGKSPGGKPSMMKRMGGMFKGAGKGALGLMGRAAAPLAVGASIYEGYQGFQQADQLVESGEINPETGQAYTEQDETAGKTEAVTKAGGGAAGALAGAAAGAAIGSVVPVVGTAIGGIVGGALGYFAGGAAGEGIGDALTTTSGEAALEAAEDSGLYDKDMLGDSEINPEILAQTTDPAQLQAIIADDDLGDEDMNMVKSRLAQIKDFEAVGGGSSMSASSEGQASIEKQEGSTDVVGEKRGREIPTQGQTIYQAEKQTGPAVAQATESAASEQSMQPIINNITNNSGGGSSPPPIVTAPLSVRPASSTIQRYQDSRYGG